MNPSSFFLFAGPRPVRLKWLLLGWLGAELLVFLLLVKAIGLGSTILLGLATTVLGMVLLRRVGVQALVGLQQSFDPRSQRSGAMAEGMLAGLSALLLIIPGFLANAAGLLLAAPSVRQRARAAFDREPAPSSFGRPPQRAGGEVIDLGPGDWSPVDRG